MLSAAALGSAYEDARPELVSYLTRMVLHHDLAQDLAQEAALRLVTTDHGIGAIADVRPWLFRVSTRLAIDHLRREGTRRDFVLLTARRRAAESPTFQAQSEAMRGSPDITTIAREHLAICIACTLRNLPAEQAAILLLVEVYEFTIPEAASFAQVTFGQAKHALFRARAQLRARYQATCALVAKEGVCHQCSELNEFFHQQPQDPLAGSSRDLGARLRIARELRDQPVGPWHTLMLRLVDDLLVAH
jgi:RNA polymerase sigma-70 factor (ECF subfamily)